jgi:hypothetical protein
MEMCGKFQPSVTMPRTCHRPQPQTFLVLVPHILHLQVLRFIVLQTMHRDVLEGWEACESPAAWCPL